MGAEAAVNAVYYNKLAEIDDEAERDAEIERLRREYEDDIDIVRLAGELVVDDVVEPEDLRAELIRAFAAAAARTDRSPAAGTGSPRSDGGFIADVSAVLVLDCRSAGIVESRLTIGS